MNSERYVIDGKLYELPEAMAGEYKRLNDEFHEAIRNVEYPPLPRNCLSAKYNEGELKVVREYRARFRELLVEVEEQPTS